MTEALYGPWTECKCFASSSGRVEAFWAFWIEGMFFVFGSGPGIEERITRERDSEAKRVKNDDE